MTLLMPISTVRSLNMKHEDNLIEGYTEYHGHPPNEQSTVREWFDSMKLVQCLWFVRHVLMPKFPDKKELFDTVSRDVAFICMESVLPLWEIVDPKDQWLRYTFNTAKRFVEQQNDTDKEKLCRLRSAVEATTERTGRMFWAADLGCHIIQLAVNNDNDVAKHAYFVTFGAYFIYHEQWKKDKIDRVEIDNAIESAHKRLDQLLNDLEGVTQ